MMKKSLCTACIDYTVLIVGCLMVAVGLDFFLIPCKITAGGVSGISTILWYSFHLPVGATMLAFNAVLFLIAFWVLGKSFGVRSLVSTLLLSGFIDGLIWISPLLRIDSRTGVTHDFLLATVFGGILCGIGMAMVFLKNASTGGTDILAVILNKASGIPMGKSLMAIDVLVTIGAGFAFGADKAMFAIIAIFVSTKVIDTVMEGLNQGRQFLIFSDHHEAIAKDILHLLDRGVTLVPAVGGYTGETRTAVLSVVRPREIPKLKAIVVQHDPKAFVVLSDVHEIIGEGFSRRL